MRLAIALLAVLVYASPSKANGFWFFSYSSARWCAPGLLAVRQASFIRVNWGATGYSSCFRYGAVVPAYGVWWRGPCLCSPWGYGVPGVAMVVPVASPVFPLGPLTLPVAATVPSGSSAQSPGLTPVFPPSGDRRRAKLAPREQADRLVDQAREALANDLRGLARDHLQAARKLDPDSRVIQLLLGQTLLMLGKHHAAAKVLRPVWADDGLLVPEMRGTLTGLADTPAFRDALDKLETLRVQFPDDPDIVFLEAQGRTLAGHDALARPHWKRLATHAPDRAVAGRVLVQNPD